MSPAWPRPVYSVPWEDRARNARADRHEDHVSKGCRSAEAVLGLTRPADVVTERHGHPEQVLSPVA
jgi:hypothetical protein